MKKSDERGLAMVFELVMVAMVLVVAGYAVYHYMKLRDPVKSNSTAKSTATPKVPDIAWAKGGVAVSGKYADADVVQTGEKSWRMYYANQPENSGGQLNVYSSTSTDGKTWTADTGIRKTMATFPSVIKLKDGRYRMYYQNAGVIRSAVAADGLTFADEAGVRIDLTNPEGLVFNNVAAPTVQPLDDGSFMMVYRGTINSRYAADTPNATTQVLMWATSPDGLTFTKKGLAVDSRTSQLAGQLDGPELVKWDDDKQHVFATSYTGVYEFVFDGTKFGPGKLAFSLGESSNSNTVASAPPPGDPTVMKIGGVWHMYYGTKDGIGYANYK